MHIKNFDSWSKEKQYIDKIPMWPYFAEREIWWWALGVNIGVEIDGKNGKFERPIVILKRVNKDMIVMVPLTTKNSDGRHFEIKTVKTKSFAKITQLKTISSKRLLRKMDTLEDAQFQNLKNAVLDFLA